MRHALLLVGLNCLICAATSPAARAETLTPEEIRDGWLQLFDGETTFGWESNAKTDWRVVDGAISAASGEPGLLCTTSEFADYVLKLEFRSSPQTNSGVFLRTPLKPTDPAKDCYELNIAAPDVSPFYTGSFVNRQKASLFQASGDWQAYEVTANGGRFIVKLNDKIVLDYFDKERPGRGRIGLQYRSGPISFRNIRLKPLGQLSIFNGHNLKGWTVFPDKKSVYSVTKSGELNVTNGNGQLESTGQYADFTLQLEIFSAGDHLNSGIFFRSIPGEFWNGYEAQIQNGYKDGDRTKPVDCGTGGIYRRQNARKVVSNDFEWFAMTVLAVGPHISTWVNGYPVADWTDIRPPDPNPRKGLRTAAGTLIIQGHDPTTNLSFRNLQVQELPAR
jgi:hypothetical protein